MPVLCPAPWEAEWRAHYTVTRATLFYRKRAMNTEDINRDEVLVKFSKPRRTITNDINHDKLLLSLIVADEPKDWNSMQHHQKVKAFHSTIREYFKLSEQAIYLTYNVIFDLQPGSWKSNIIAAFPALNEYVNWYEKIKSGELQPPSD